MAKENSANRTDSAASSLPALHVGVATYNSAQHQQVVLVQDKITIGTDSNCDAMIEGDSNVSALHCQLTFTEQPAGLEVEIVNLGQSIVLDSGSRLHRNQPHRAMLPLKLSIGDTRVQIFEVTAKANIDESLNYLPPQGDSPAEVKGISEAVEISPAPSTLAAWLETIGELQKSVAGSHAFFKEAARAIFNPGGLDGSFILLPHGNIQTNSVGSPSTSSLLKWKIVASHIPFSDSPIRFRADLVQRAVEQGVTLFHDSSQLTASAESQSWETAVVSPVFNHHGEVIAVVYGFRGQRHNNNRIGARTLEAQFVQLIANSILSAMTRLEKEAEATRSRVLLEQAFSPKVVRHLEANPVILEGRTTDVTVLFVDLRSFSTISDHAGPKVTYQLLTDVMDQFSEIVARHDGVIIDYFGDGLSAFWNAPIEQPDHVLLACRAAEDLLACLPELNEVWAHRLQQRLRVGVGIHTGVAQVGNSGSTSRLKYGPSGSTVNIASRLESATKGIGLPILVSESVANQVKEFYVGRRVCRTALAGISTPMDVYELFPRPVSAAMIEQLEKYDQCLNLYEEGKFLDAITQLIELNLEMPDQASEFLLEQAMDKNKHKIDRRKKTNPKSDVAALVENSQGNDLAKANLVSNK